MAVYFILLTVSIELKFLFANKFEKLLAYDKITASCQTNMPPKQNVTNNKNEL